MLQHSNSCLTRIESLGSENPVGVFGLPFFTEVKIQHKMRLNANSGKLDPLSAFKFEPFHVFKFDSAGNIYLLIVSRSEFCRPPPIASSGYRPLML